MAQGDRQGLGDRRVLDAAGLHERAFPARGEPRASGRAHAGDPAPDRPLAPQRHRPPRLGERTITIDCDVLQADAGTRTASITGGYIALAHRAARPGGRRRRSRRSPGRQRGRGSVGIVDGEARLDLCYEEDAGAEVDFNVVMTGVGRRSSRCRGRPRASRSVAVPARRAARPRRRRHRAAHRASSARRWPADRSGRGPAGRDRDRDPRTTHKLRELARICADWPVDVGDRRERTNPPPSPTLRRPGPPTSRTPS